MDFNRCVGGTIIKTLRWAHQCVKTVLPHSACSIINSGNLWCMWLADRSNLSLVKHLCIRASLWGQRVAINSACADWVSSGDLSRYILGALESITCLSYTYGLKLNCFQVTRVIWGTTVLCLKMTTGRVKFVGPCTVCHCQHCLDSERTRPVVDLAINL